MTVFRSCPERVVPFVVLAFLFGAMRPAQAANPGFDHALFDALLKKHVENGMVDYGAFRASADFPKYLASLEKAEVLKLPEAERLAFWINTYNAYTIQLILEHNEKDSIRNINKSLFFKGHGPWREKLVKAGGQVYHLDNVEHDIIRKEFKEPRIHFALVCGALGCPPLRNEAYAGGLLDSQLQDQARTFLLHSPEKNHVDVVKGILYCSPVVSQYYREDFGTTDEKIGRYLSQFYPEGKEKQLLLSGKVKLEPTDYDWTLNSQEKAARESVKAKP